MPYRVVKLFVRLAARLFCRKITINDTDLLQSKGPLLLACNHPNSFLDAVILVAILSGLYISWQEEMHFEHPLLYFTRDKLVDIEYQRIGILE
jgi:1-acyl-sn-glycerol-3-phosphate acyltransferase